MERAWRDFVAWMARNRDAAWLGRVRVLPVASGLSSEAPPFFFDQLDHVADFHVI